MFCGRCGVFFCSSCSAVFWFTTPPPLFPLHTMVTFYQAQCNILYLCFFQLLGNWEAQARRIMKMIAGGGLSITGSHTMCGDYLYSGHTVMLTLTYLFIKECKFHCVYTIL